MKRTIAFTIFALAIAGGCRRGSETVQRSQEEYQVVQEGSTSGVTSTLGAPGEVPPLVATNTAVDTTTNFTLPTTTMPQPQDPGSLAGTLPQNTSPLYGGYPSAPPRPAPRPRPAPPAPQPPPPPMSSSSQPEPPPATDTTVTTTDTTATQAPPATDTVAPHPPAEKPPDPPPPPPPTQTDTNAQKQ